MKINPTMAKSIPLFVAAIILLMASGLELPYVDKHTDAYFGASMTKAGLAYGVCRAVNASVSVIKDSQIQLEPAGLGVSLAVGQVLDPLDDMTERVSDILVTAIVSLGIQKIAYELCVAFVPPLIGIAMIVLAGLLFIKGDRAMALRAIMLKTIVLLAVARLCLPASSIINAYVHENYFSNEITKAKDELAMSTPEMERLKDMRLPKVDGVVGTVTNGFNFVGGKTADLAAAVKTLIKNMGGMINNLLKLSYLYMSVFCVQVILLPIGAFWLLTRIANAFFGTGIPYILKPSDPFAKSSVGKERASAGQ